ncbi:MAG: ABC transporter permease [Bacillota bacterium]|nr:ABC transporter permease [Bacillota bacterium]
MMEKRRLTTFVLAVKNLKKRSFRSKGLMAIVAVFAFTIFCGALLSQSIRLGRNYMSGRMGADIMVVPRGYALELQNILLRSESGTFYMDENLAEGIASMAGIEKVSPQLYIGSLNASCCSVPVQLIGYDPKCDFTIKSWMTSMDSSKLGFEEVVTGSRVNSTVGSQIWLFGQPLIVAAKIDDTGMGFDSAVFMTMETAQHLIETSAKTAVHPAGSGKDRISALFIKLSDDIEPSAAAKTILKQYPQADVVVLKDMIQHISGVLKNIRGLIYGIQALLWIVSVLFLIVIFTVSTNERKREFGLFLAMGATRKKLERLLMTEALLICVIGALCGIAAACFIMFEFRLLIAVSLGIPYLLPTTGSTIILAVITLLISILNGAAACIYSVKRISRLENNAMIREYE